MDERKVAWIALNMAGVGPSRANKLTEAFGSPQEALRAPKEKLKEVAGIGEVVSERIYRLGRDKAGEKEFGLAEKKGIKIITFEEKEYPYLLKQIYDPPVVLYVKGEISDKDKI
jgi:DNA processing protein